METRVFSLEKLARFDANVPQKVLVYQSDKTLGAMWCLEPGQEVFLHQHPNADDVWICLEGESGLYFAGDGQEVNIKKVWQFSPKQEKLTECAIQVQIALYLLVSLGRYPWKPLSYKQNSVSIHKFILL